MILSNVTCSQQGQARLPTLKRNDSGQALLIVILVMVVALTVGLSIASRTITNIRNTENEELSQAALSAAEAGIEEFVRQPCPTGTCVVAQTYTKNNSSADVVIKVATGTQVAMNQGNPLKKDEGGDIWLVPHNDPNGAPTWASSWNGNLNLYWGNPNDTECQTAAIETIIVQGTVTAPRTTRYVFDDCDARRAGNSFTDPGAAGNYNVDGVRFKYNVRIPPAGNLAQGLFIRVVPLYFNARVGFSGNGLPPQGRIIESTGTAGETKRKVTFIDPYPGLPSEMIQYLQLSTQ